MLKLLKGGSPSVVTAHRNKKTWYTRDNPNHHRSIYCQRKPLINKPWDTRMTDTWLTPPVHLYLQNIGKVCGRSRAWGVLGCFMKWSKHFKLASKLASNRSCCWLAVPFKWVHPVENLTINTYPKFWLGYGTSPQITTELKYYQTSVKYRKLHHVSKKSLWTLWNKIDNHTHITQLC